MKKKILLVIPAAMILISAGMAAPANAAEGDISSTDGTAAALAGIDGSLKLTPADGAGLGTTDLTAATVHIPADPADGVTVAIEGVDLKIGLPGASAAEDGVPLADGTVTYSARAFSNSVIASEQGVQMLTTIAGPNAPARYEYSIDVPAGGALKEVGGGAAAVFNEDGNPVVMIAPSAKATSRLVKRALEADSALATACYVPVGEGAEALAAQLAREHGLRAMGGAARRLVQATGGDRAVMARELEKLALYLDAAPDRPQQLDDDALDAVGADLGEAEMSEIVEAVIAGRSAELGAALRRMSEAGGSPIPWLRQLARRLGALAEMRADVAAGGDVASVVKRHRVFFREEAATAAALRRWTPEALVEAQRRVRQVERSLVASGTAGNVLADQAMLGMAERARRLGR